MLIFLDITNGPYQGREAKLKPDQSFTIGRSKQADGTPPRDDFLSRQYCEVFWDSQTCRLHDLDSTNGTWYQNGKINRVELLDGDSFTAGESTFKMVYTDKAAQAEKLPEQDLLEFLKAQSDPLFALLDAARDEKVWKFLEELPSEQYQCLFTGRQARTLAKYGPHLLMVDHSLLEKVLPKFWGESWGYFLSASCDFEQLLQHLRQFLLVKDQATGKQRFFRFYDPRVLRRFLPTCSAAQLAEIFVTVQSFLLEDADPSVLLEYTLANMKLHRRTISVRMDPLPVGEYEKNRIESFSLEI